MYISETCWSTAGVVPTPARRTVLLGKNSEGQRVTLPTSGTNVVVSGDPRAGKSWIAGLLAEQLIEQGYRICVIDPEGDYARMGERPRVVTFGDELALLSPAAAARPLSNEAISIILALSSLAPQDQLHYVDQLLAALQETRQSTGCPQWIVIDEAHYFFQAQSLKHLNNPTGSFCLVTYRPSLWRGGSMTTSARTSSPALKSRKSVTSSPRSYRRMIICRCPCTIHSFAWNRRMPDS